MPNKINITGQTFGRWQVLYETAERDKSGSIKWWCKCECGNYGKVTSGALISGGSKSCGCYFRESVAERFTTHGHSPADKVSSEYSSWQHMIQRCTNPKFKHFAAYGGRGITVCERWRLSFDDFLSDMGLKPTPQHTIDRYPNANGNYEPDNCRWATPAEQAISKRNNIWLEYNGERKVLNHWAKELGVSGWRLKYYSDKGLSLSQIIEKFKAVI